MALLPQAEGTVMSFLGGGLFIEQLHQPSPPPEVHAELVEKIAVHKWVLIGYWGEETADEDCWVCWPVSAAVRKFQAMGAKVLGKSLVMQMPRELGIHTGSQILSTC